ncbi:MAG: transglutaminase domain-containing protein [Acidobacteriota bacterium]
MTSLDDYLFALDPVPEERLFASGLAALGLAANGSGTCGVTTLGTGLPLPLPEVAAAGSWPPLGVCLLPSPLALADIAGWHPAWGGIGLPLPAGLGGASVPAVAQAVLTPLFALSGTGADGLGNLNLAVTAVSGLNRTGQGALRLPPVVPRAQVCSLESPASGAATTSDAVMGLLCRGDADLAATVAAAGVPVGLPVGDPDAVAAALLALVAGRIAYVAEANDAWTCAAATLGRGSGDCEDGAVLLHALLLAARLPADRIVTAFGRVGVDRAGHAWVAWRRIGDGRWVVLDWTLGPDQGPVTGLPVLSDPGPYAWVDYALTAGAFFTVRQEAGAFFARALGDGVTLPRLDVAAAGSLGALGAPALPGDWSTWGLAGAGGVAALRPPRVAASGRFGWGQAALTAWDGLGQAGAAAASALAALSGDALAGGGGLATARLARPEAVGRSTTAARTAATCRLARLAGASLGLPGCLGNAGCVLPRPRQDGLALMGWLGQGAVLLPMPLTGSLGQPVSLGQATALLDRWRAAGLGHAAGGAPEIRNNGEEWA